VSPQVAKFLGHKVADYLEEFVQINGGEKIYKLFNQVKASRAIGVSSCGQKRLDFVILNVSTGKCVAIEVDGRDHYSEDGRSYTESHMERVDILQRAGWNILHLPYYKWWKNGWLCDRNDIDFKNNIKDFYNEVVQLIG
jgi:very-short-patch-repair endonuclease